MADDWFDETLGLADPGIAEGWFKDKNYSAHALIDARDARVEWIHLQLDKPCRRYRPIRQWRWMRIYCAAFYVVIVPLVVIFSRWP